MPRPITDAAPPIRLRCLLSVYRERGAGFQAAWRASLGVVLAEVPASQGARRRWREALESTRGAWAAGYARRRDASSNALEMIATAA